MTRTHDLPVQPRLPRAAGGRVRPSYDPQRPYDPAAYELHGDSAKALAALGLQPREARVLVIPASARAAERLRKMHAGRPVSGLDADTSVAAGPTRPARPPVIDQAAFAPDARSQALLQGVRIAQQDLRDAGGAYDLDKCARCYTASPASGSIAV